MHCTHALPLTRCADGCTGLCCTSTTHLMSACVSVHSHIKGLMEEAGLQVREDVMGNIFGRWDGSQPGTGEGASIMSCLEQPTSQAAARVALLSRAARAVSISGSDLGACFSKWTLPQLV